MCALLNQELVGLIPIISIALILWFKAMLAWLPQDYLKEFYDFVLLGAFYPIHEKVCAQSFHSFQDSLKYDCGGEEGRRQNQTHLREY